MTVEIPPDGEVLRIRYRPRPGWPIQEIKFFWDSEDNMAGQFYGVRSAQLVGSEWVSNPIAVLQYMELNSLNYAVQQKGGIGPFTVTTLVPLIRAHCDRYYDVTPDNWPSDTQPDAPFDLQVANLTMARYLVLFPSTEDTQPDVKVLYRPSEPGQPPPPMPKENWDYVGE